MGGQRQWHAAVRIVKEPTKRAMQLTGFGFVIGYVRVANIWLGFDFCWYAGKMAQGIAVELPWSAEGQLKGWGIYVQEQSRTNRPGDQAKGAEGRWLARCRELYQGDTWLPAHTII